MKCSLHDQGPAPCARTFCIANLQSAGGRACSWAEGLLRLPCINHTGSYWAYVKQPIQLPRLARWLPKTETGLLLYCLANAAKYVVQGSRIPVQSS